MKNLLNHPIPIILFTIFLLSCSESNFKKEIPINGENAISRLVVVAALDNDYFYAFVNKSYPISSKEVKVEIVDKATVKLYEDGVLVLEVNKRDPQPENNDVPPSLYVHRKNMKVKPGKTYRLEVSAVGYPTVQSTVVAPQYPMVNNVNLDIRQNIIRPENSIYSDYTSNFCKYFLPLRIDLSDKANEKNFYLIQAFKGNEIDPIMFSGNEIAVATTDRLLIQDNPFIEAKDVLSSAEYSTFLFSKLLITDLTFSGKNIKLDLLLSNCDLLPNNDYGGIKQETPEVTLFIKSVTSHFFDYYRSFMLQNPDDGANFFSEPVAIQGNINEGYGCFSVATTVRYKLLEP